MKEQLIKKFQNFCFHNELFKKGDKIVIALSGGPDSTALVLVFSKLVRKYNLKLLAIHINYGLRGKDSVQDEAFSRKLCEKLSIPIKIYKYKKTRGVGNLEEKLRDFRYEIFKKEKCKNSFNAVATAHTMDDQVETFFMNLLRGSGSAGLSSLKVKRDCFIRPLLFATKKELLVFLKQHRQDYRIDKSNFNLDFFRNRVRTKLIPWLEKNYNQNLKKVLTSTIEHLTDENTLTGIITEKTFRKLAKTSPNVISFRKDRLKKLEPALLKKIFRKAIVKLTGNLKNIGTAHYFEFKKIIFSDKSKSKIIKFGSLTVAVSDKIVIFKKFLK